MKLNNCQYISKKRRGLCSVVLFLVLAMTISWMPVYAASSLTEVASIEHDSFKSLGNSFVQIDADTFALAYS